MKAAHSRKGSCWLKCLRSGLQCFERKASVTLALIGFTATTSCGLGGESELLVGETKHEDTQENAGIDELAVDSPTNSTELCGAALCLGKASLCAPDLGECVECLEDSECNSASLFCSQLGICGECKEDSRCGEGKACDQRLATCTETCNTDDDCTSVCDRERGICVECDTDDDCDASEGESCDPVQKRCGECTEHSHCTEDSPSYCDRVELSCTDD